MDDSSELLAIAKVVRVTLAGRHKSEHCHHVGGNFRIHSPQSRQIEPATVGRVPPTQEELGSPSTLAGVRLRDSNEPLQCRLLSDRHRSTRGNLLPTNGFLLQLWLSAREVRDDAKLLDCVIGHSRTQGFDEGFALTR